jgi:uncharacterized membrane protein YfcA
MDFSILQCVGFVVMGYFVAAFGTLVGAGGGIFFVPIFLYFFGWEPTLVIGTSLTVVMFNALSGSYAYIKQKKVLYRAAIAFSIATIPGAILGAIWSNNFNGVTFRFSFGVLLLLISLVIGFKNWNKNNKTPEVEIDKDQFRFNMAGGIGVSFIVGFISSIFGIGGGVIHVPAMVYLLGFPTHIATATSHFVLAISSMVGVASHFAQGHILYTPAFFAGIGAVFGAQLGAKISKRVKARVILMLLSIALFMLAARLIITSGFISF